MLKTVVLEERKVTDATIFGLFVYIVNILGL